MSCKRCGACCNMAVIEITAKDIEREPLLKQHSRLLDGHGTIKYEPGKERYALQNLRNGGCAFLVNNACQIYSTRPDECRNIKAGGQQCEFFRSLSRIMF